MGGAFRAIDTYVGEVHEVIRIVIEYEEIVLAGNPVDFLPPVQRHNRAGRIGPGRIYVHHPGHPKSLVFALPQALAQTFRHYTQFVLIDGY